jgi:hypothetical protein
MRHSCSLQFFDFLVSLKRDAWGRGRYSSEEIPKPKPLSHNKTAFAIRRLGLERMNRLKELARSLNSLL